MQKIEQTPKSGMPILNPGSEIMSGYISQIEIVHGNMVSNGLNEGGTVTKLVSYRQDHYNS